MVLGVGIMTVIHGTNARVQVSPDGGKTWLDIQPLTSSTWVAVEREPDMQAMRFNGDMEPEEMHDTAVEAFAAAASAMERPEIEHVTVRKMQNPRISRAANLRHPKPGR